MKKIHITSLGCPKNTVDSEVLEGQLLNRGFIVSDNPGLADIIIINTCAFIRDAKEESIEAILEAVEIKNKYRDKKVFVIGCLAQRYRNEIVREIPGIDDLFGIEDYNGILKVLGENNYDPETIYNTRSISTPGHYAYLKISDGCNRKCSFCIIPSIKGQYRSRSIDSILLEASILANKGVKELIIVSQDTSYYGIDLYGRQSICELLKEIAQANFFKWIRPLYWYPSNFPLEVMSLMEECPAVLPYVDLPVQHTSENILSSMKRGKTEKSLEQLFQRMREQIPDIVLRTSFILGYPGESAHDFDRLTTFIKKIRFNHAGVFLYSDEEGTPAFNFKPKINQKTARARMDKLMNIQQEISLEYNNSLVDTSQRVLIDNYNHEMKYYTGRTYRDAPEIDNEVIIQGDVYVKKIIGTFREIEIIDASEYELYGEFKDKV